MAIIGIQSLLYGVDDIESCVTFHQEFGLSVVAQDQRGADLEVFDGSTIKIRAIDDPELPASVLENPSVRELIWRVDGKSASKDDSRQRRSQRSDFQRFWRSKGGSTSTPIVTPRSIKKSLVYSVG